MSECSANWEERHSLLVGGRETLSPTLVIYHPLFILQGHLPPSLSLSLPSSAWLRAEQLNVMSFEKQRDNFKITLLCIAFSPVVWISFWNRCFQRCWLHEHGIPFLHVNTEREERNFWFIYIFVNSFDFVKWWWFFNAKVKKRNLLKGSK